MKPWPHSQRPKGSPVFCFANRCALPIDHKYDAPCARRRLIYATRLQPLLYCERTGSSTSTSPSSARWRFTPASGSSLKFTVSTRTSMDPVPPSLPPPAPPALTLSPEMQSTPLRVSALDPVFLSVPPGWGAVNTTTTEKENHSFPPASHINGAIFTHNQLWSDSN